MTHYLTPAQGAVGWLLISCAALLTASVFVTGSRSADLRGDSRVVLFQRFVADEDNGQCGFAQTRSRTPFGLWSPPVYINTDGRPGGCRQSFAIVDPDGELAGWSMRVKFEYYGRQKQCDQTGEREVPASRTADDLIWTPSYRIDTDEREGGCSLEFSVHGRTDIVLDIEMYADGDPGQCPDRGLFTATIAQPITVRIDTDERPGGCYQRLRLRRTDQDKQGR